MSSPDRTPTILIVDDYPDAIATLREPLEVAGYDVLGAASREEALQVLENSFIDLLLSDERLGRASGTKLLESCRTKYPGLGGILITGHADLDIAIKAMRAGALDLLQKPVRKEELLASVTRSLADTRLTREARFHRWRASHNADFPDIIGESEALNKALDLVRRVAVTQAPVLIQGESGTGKELFAKAIHARGPRCDGPFIGVNAGALPPTLLESTLFGSKKGAFTDSRTDQPGLFEAAEGGTLFLDEIGETTPDVQVRLLRVLQERVIMRVGDIASTPINVRVIAATNRDLRAEADAGRFRPDLYYRLAVITITVPPLRERASDIKALAEHFLEKHAKSVGQSISKMTPEVLDRLIAYRWPGNVRELDNVIHGAVILAENGIIRPELLSYGSTDPTFEKALNGTFREAELAFERMYFPRLLARAGNNKTKAAEMAGIDRSVLHEHLKKLLTGPPN